jgi:hypothetical protein
MGWMPGREEFVLDFGFAGVGGVVERIVDWLDTRVRLW